MKPEPKYSKEARALKIGRYRHYKGGEYEIMGVAYHSDTGRELVVYRALYGTHCLFVRSLKVFVQNVKWQGKKVPRFRYLGKNKK